MIVVALVIRNTAHVMVGNSHLTDKSYLQLNFVNGAPNLKLCSTFLSPCYPKHWPWVKGVVFIPKELNMKPNETSNKARQNHENNWECSFFLECSVVYQQQVNSEVRYSQMGLISQDLYLVYNSMHYNGTIHKARCQRTCSFKVRY